MCLKCCCFQTSVAHSKLNNLRLELEHHNLRKQHSVKLQPTKARITVSFINIFGHALVWQPSDVATYCCFSGPWRGNVEHEAPERTSLHSQSGNKTTAEQHFSILKSCQMLIGSLWCLKRNWLSLTAIPRAVREANSFLFFCSLIHQTYGKTWGLQLFFFFPLSPTTSLFPF